MTWPEYAAARQFLVEEHIGTHVRAQQRQEEFTAQRSVEAIRRRESA